MVQECMKQVEACSVDPLAISIAGAARCHMPGWPRQEPGKHAPSRQIARDNTFLKSHELLDICWAMSGPVLIVSFVSSMLGCFASVDGDKGHTKEDYLTSLVNLLRHAFEI